VGADLFTADRRANIHTYIQTDKHDEANIPFLQFCEFASKLQARNYHHTLVHLCQAHGPIGTEKHQHFMSVRRLSHTGATSEGDNGKLY
jgi:hypothetical protein